MIPLRNFDTLFLDRDGVINRKLPGDYVRKPEEFIFLPEVPEVIAMLSELFRHIIIITNQQGIGRGAMTEADLEVVHRFMMHGIRGAGGRIDRIYHCPHLEGSGSIYRKPATGMGILAKNDFPDIEFSRTLMVGDSITDMEFGEQLGTCNVLIVADPSSKPCNKPAIHHVFKTLKEFSQHLI